MPGEQIAVGDRLRLFGGYDMEPRWLAGHSHYLGVLESFMPGQNRELAAVIRLDAPITVEGVSGNLLVLELRYEGARWTSEGIVHVELCDFEPERKPWAERRQGKWVESHAPYERIDPKARRVE